MLRARKESTKKNRLCASSVRGLGAMLLFIAVGAHSTAEASSQPANKIVLIGGQPRASYTPGSHDFPKSIKFLDTLLQQTPELVGQHGLTVQSHPYGWPTPEELEGAATLVLNFSGIERHPLLDPANRSVVAKLMDRGVGLVALHQTFTVPEGDTSVPLLQWLGGVRYGIANRTTMPAKILVTSDRHAVARGLETFIHRDEYYPTIEFNHSTGKLTPIWSADLPIHYVRGKPVVGTEAQRYTVAWAYEREKRGRSVAFSGAHFLEDMDNPQMRRLLLNSILWTAGKDVPAGGVVTAAHPRIAADLLSRSRGRTPVTTAVVSKAKDNTVIDMPWGELRWYTSGEQSNTDTLTTGLATILPGQANPVHYHPNCDEVLHVLKGRIRHSMDGKTVEMSAGDTVSIPQGVHHNATNIGDEPALLAISFSTAWREVMGE